MGSIPNIDPMALLTLVGSLTCACIGGYIAIRVDLARLHERMAANATNTKSALDRANDAHARIDRILGT